MSGRIVADCGPAVPYSGGMLDLEAIWKAWETIVSWFTILSAVAVLTLLADRADAGLTLAVIAVGILMIGIGRTLMYLLHAIWVRGQD